MTAMPSVSQAKLCSANTHIARHQIIVWELELMILVKSSLGVQRGHRQALMVPIMVAGEAIQQLFIENIPWSGPGFVDSAKIEPDPVLPHMAPTQ